MNQSNENHLRETEEILRDNPATRDDDILLWWLLCYKFHSYEFNQIQHQGDPGQVGFLEAFRKLPKLDSIKRYRRTLREKYPSSKEAEEKRRKEQEESKHFYAANGQGMMFTPSALNTIDSPPVYRGTNTETYAS